MAARYQVLLYNHQGQQLALLDSWRSLTVERKLNGISTHTLSLNSRSPFVQYFDDDIFVQVMRRDQALGVDWTSEYFGFHITPQRQISAGNHRIFTSYGRSLEDLLNRRSLLYKAPYEKTGPADNVMKAFVNENAGPGATSPPRLFDGVTSALTIEANNSLATVWTGQRSWKNLLDVLQEISAFSGVDFSIEINLPGPGGFIFRTYYPQRGSDRTQTTGVVPHIFSPDFGNLKTPSYTNSKTEEITAVIVAGQGEEAARTVIQRTAILTSQSPWARKELVRDARNEATVLGLESVGDAELVKLAAKESLSFELLQTRASAYGKDYFFGDLVTISFEGIVRDLKITGVRFTMAEGHEQMNFEFGTLEPFANEGTLIRSIVRRIQAIEHSGEI